ncbi:MAG: cobalamin-dependent protein, partial [Bdellovibrionales bacterium]|nr:cobalamin-dependent protein [Bdellovibrionales bacterium]
MKTLLVIPPMTQLNTPYPSTAYLKSYLDSKNIECDQKDFGIDLIDRLFSKDGLQKIYTSILNNPQNLQDDSVQFFIDAFSDYQATIEPVKAFLRGHDTSLALRLANRALVPEGPRFLPLSEHKQFLGIFGSQSTHDKAKYIGSLYFDDIADIIRKAVDDKFEFSRYGEKLASSQTSFSALSEQVENSNTIIDQILQEIVSDYMQSYSPDVIALTAPFPGNVYGAIKIAKFAKAIKPTIKIVLGGGYVNTELRTLNDKRFFTYIDYLIFDDGERALECVIECLEGKRKKD